MSVYIPWVREGIVPWEHRDFWAMPWREADKFCKWFIESSSNRVQALEQYVRSTDTFESWRANTSAESFELLGPWFLKTIQTRRISSQEREASSHTYVVTNNLQQAIIRDIQNRPTDAKWTYVDKELARSVIADIGTYMANCLRKSGKHCKWDRCRDKRHMSYNQPLLYWPQSPTGFAVIHEAGAAAYHMAESTVATSQFAQMLSERLVLATYQQAVYIPTVQREGFPDKTRCPKCEFSHARVLVQEGVYCNHCGHIVLADPDQV